MTVVATYSGAIYSGMPVMIEDIRGSVHEPVTLPASGLFVLRQVHMMTAVTRTVLSQAVNMSNMIEHTAVSVAVAVDVQCIASSSFLRRDNLDTTPLNLLLGHECETKSERKHESQRVLRPGGDRRGSQPHI